MKKPILLFLLMLSFHFTVAQSFGFVIEEEKEVVKIPFDIYNNFMVVEVTINDRLPLKFIFDTGAEHTILSKNIFAGFLGLKYDRPIRIIGADLNQELVAYVSNKVSLKVGKEAVAPHQDILILADDYFKIDEYVGLEIHGIIGADLFRNLVLKIDFGKNEIQLRRSRNFKPPRRSYQEIPVSIEKSKPYILAKTKVDDKLVDIKLLMDTGASLSLLLHTNTNEDLKLPETYVNGSIGRGLGGMMEGFIGRLNRLEFGDYFFNNIITNYQDISEARAMESIVNRNGIMGNALLSRFDIIIDYPQEKLYMKAHRKYNKGFKYDRSGLELIVSGKNLNVVTVYNVIKKSPAGEAGFQKGDEIISINYMPSKLLDLKGVTRKLTKKVGKKIRVKLKRGGKKMVLIFLLRDLI